MIKEYKGFIPAPLDERLARRGVLKCFEDLNLFTKWYAVLILRDGELVQTTDPPQVTSKKKKVVLTWKFAKEQIPHWKAGNEVVVFNDTDQCVAILGGKLIAQTPTELGLEFCVTRHD